MKPSHNKGVHKHALDHCQFCPLFTPHISFSYQATKPSHPFSSMEVHASKGGSSISSLAHFPSPNVTALLKIKVISWSQETGLHVSIRIRVANRTFNLHKHPLISKSGYLRRALEESNEVELPTNFPGGAETFETIALFIYGSSTLIDPFNVAALRCAAEFLEMKEEYQGSGNLCERFDMYLNQVVLQRWEDAVIVLKKCQTLHPLAEELLIVSRCIESLAFMACMEILDPERRREHPVIAVEALANQPWNCNCERLEQILNQELWIKDLISLPFSFFKRVIGSLRRQGMKEKFISPIIMFFACKWVLPSSLGEEEWEEKSVDNFSNDDNEKGILQGVVALLPMREKASKVIPVGFYFSLLSRCLHLGVEFDFRQKLQEQIVSLLHLAQVEDFLIPCKSGGTEGTCSTEHSISSSMELGTMQSLFSCYLSSHGVSSPSRCSIVAELWDMYLCQIANDSQIDYRRFMDLIEIMPISTRQTHDFLYRALNNFLLAHPNLSQEEKGKVCKYLNCQKLSQEVCVEAVQNELMPLRLIVQALFVQQLNTHQALRECSESFRYTHSGEFSGSISSSRYANSKSQNLGESPMPYDVEGSELLASTGSHQRPRPRPPLSSFLYKDTMIPRPLLPPPESRSELSSTSKENYESTSFRIQNLEQELITLKNTLQMHNSGKVTKKKVAEKQVQQHQSSRPYGLEGRTSSKKRNNGVGQVTNCIGTVNMSSQRKYASKILKIFRRISLFSRGRSKRKNNCATGLHVDRK